MELKSFFSSFANSLGEEKYLDIEMQGNPAKYNWNLISLLSNIQVFKKSHSQDHKAQT